MTGTVKTYIEKRGFGFIVPDDESPELFVHIKAVKYGTLAKGARVDYELGKDREGRSRATKVMVLDKKDAEPPKMEASV